MTRPSGCRSVGLDFGTTNSVVGIADGRAGRPHLIGFGDGGDLFRSALCFWQDEDARGGIAVEAGPAA